MANSLAPTEDYARGHAAGARLVLDALASTIDSAGQLLAAFGVDVVLDQLRDDLALWHRVIERAEAARRDEAAR